MRRPCRDSASASRENERSMLGPTGGVVMGLLDWLWGTNPNGSGAGSSIQARPSVPAPPLNAPGGASVAPAAPSVAPSAAYGIESAIDLMRTLPFDENPDLVLRVVRKTLRSIGVSVEDIIDSASLRETALMADAAKHRGVIEQLEQEIAARRTSIDHIERELAETQGVRQRLEDAVENETKVGPMTAPLASLLWQGAGYNMSQAAPRRPIRSRRQLIACPPLVGRQLRGLP